MEVELRRSRCDRSEISVCFFEELTCDASGVPKAFKIRADLSEAEELVNGVAPVATRSEDTFI